MEFPVRLVRSLVAAVAVAVVSSAPSQPALPQLDDDYGNNHATAANGCGGGGGATPGGCDVPPAMPTAFPQITNRNEDMNDCPIHAQTRVNGICRCPIGHPKRVGRFCCTHDVGGVQNCKCPHGYVFRSNTRQLCHEVNPRDYTILVNGVSVCQDEGLKTKDGLYCCAVNQGKSGKICRCPAGKTYDHVANKCGKSIKIFF